MEIKVGEFYKTRGGEEEIASVYAAKDRIACLKIDMEVEEGECL